MPYSKFGQSPISLCWSFCHDAGFIVVRFMKVQIDFKVLLSRTFSTFFKGFLKRESTVTEISCINLIQLISTTHFFGPCISTNRQECYSFQHDLNLTKDTLWSSLTALTFQTTPSKVLTSKFLPILSLIIREVEVTKSDLSWGPNCLRSKTDKCWCFSVEVQQPLTINWLFKRLAVTRWFKKFMSENLF